MFRRNMGRKREDMKTPEFEKIQTNHDESQVIGMFLEWLQNEQEVILCTCDKRKSDKLDEEYYDPIDDTIEQLLAEYFDIDLDKVEKERRGLLDEIRKQTL